MASSKALIVGALLTMGCNDIVWNKIWDVDENLRVEAEAAADDWCEKTEGRYCPIITQGSGLPLRVATLDEYTCCGGLKRNDKEFKEIFIVLEQVDLDNCWYYIEDKATPEELRVESPYKGIWRDTNREETIRAIIMHELGHAALLPDISDDPTSIMVGVGIQWGSVVSTADGSKL